MAGTTWPAVVVAVQFPQKTEKLPVCDTRKERSSFENNAHDIHRPGKLEHFVEDAITRCCRRWLPRVFFGLRSKHSSEKRWRLRILKAVRNGGVPLGFSP
jgi:hypothetical protein